MKTNFCKPTGQTLIACLALLAKPATAQVNYAVSGNAAYVTSSPNASGNIVVASTYNGYPVTSIGDWAFENCTSLTSVTIPNSVTSIGDSAFLFCTSLTNVTIPDSVAVFGSAAFANSRLTSVTIGNSVTNIGIGAFSSCTSLTNFSVDAANSVYSSLDEVLFNKAQTTLIQFPGGRGGTYAIPNSVTNIGGLAFSSCTSLTNVTIPDSVTSIGYRAFSVCRRLTSVTIPDSVTNIGYQAFSYCTNLTNVIIPNSVTSIGQSMFDSCTSLTSVTIPNSVISLGGSAFFDCSSLTNVAIGNSVTIIGDYAFYNCTRLTNLTFLGNAPSEGVNMFDNIGAGAKVYYYYGATGWGATYGGLPTVMLGAPAPQVSAGSAGVEPGGFGFTLNGVVNQTIVVEASTNLMNWQPIWTNTLSTLSTNFVDPDWVNHPNRFYRLQSN